MDKLTDSTQGDGFFDAVKKDFKAQLQGRTSLESVLSVLIFARGFHLLLGHRLQKLMLKIPVVGKIIAKMMFYVTSCFTGCEISFYAQLDGGIYIPHTTGIVIARGAKVGSGTSIYQQVTIGQRVADNIAAPVIGQNAYLGAGSKILGGVHVGDGARIGANAVVLSDIPAEASAVGVPARIKMAVQTAV